MDQLYTIEHFDHIDGKLTAAIVVDAAHNIFKGHFPEQPVLPGVCQLQIVKELLEKAASKKLFLSEASQCKFLQMVDPTVIKNIQVFIDYSAQEAVLECNAVLKSGDATFLKMTGRFTIVE